MKTKPYPHTAIVCNRKAAAGGHDAADQEAEFDSPETIEAIRLALVRRGVDAIALEADENLSENLKKEKIAFVFNLAEGKCGRDREAQVPALLGLLNIPYMGSDATAMAVSLDKDLCKRFLSTCGVRVSRGVALRPGDTAVLKQAAALSFPLLLKPNAEGSGRGIFENCIAENERELCDLYADICRRFDGEMLAEEFLPGREFTVALLGNGKDVHVFRPMEILYRGATQGKYSVYSYKIKKDYLNYVDYKCPADIPKALEEELMRMAKTAFLALKCRDIARVDFRLNKNGEPCFLELNPLPGLAPNYSDFPMAAASEGYDFESIVFAIYKTALERVNAQGEADTDS